MFRKKQISNDKKTNSSVLVHEASNKCILRKPSKWNSLNQAYNELKVEECENDMLKCLKTSFTRFYVTLPKQNAKIWTLATNNNNETKISHSKVPIVLIHGFGGGLAMWIQNIGLYGFHQSYLELIFTLRRNLHFSGIIQLFNCTKLKFLCI